MTANAARALNTEETCEPKAPARSRSRRSEKSDSAFRTIGEASNELGLKPHVLRFWETKFSQLKPMKRTDGRRFYRPEDMRVLKALQFLLHDQGMTIKGAQKMLASSGADTILAQAPGPMSNETGQSVRELQNAVRDAVEGGAFRQSAPQDESSQERLSQLLTDLTGLKSRLDQVRNAS